MNQITINHWCKQCGLCADFCPKKVFDYTAGHTPVHRQARGRVGCKMCQWRCRISPLRLKRRETKHEKRGNHFYHGQ